MNWGNSELLLQLMNGTILIVYKVNPQEDEKVQNCNCSLPSKKKSLTNINIFDVPPHAQVASCVELYWVFLYQASAPVEPPKFLVYDTN